MFGLIDGNSFYCSCERAFDPALRRSALVVLSNNDGCVIARTQEAKDAGVKMGDPWHLISSKPGIRNMVEWRSSNYALYGDMSRRVFELLQERVPLVEPYSIDEMFLDLKGLPGDLVARCSDIRADVRRIAKIPTCVGIGPTKTIAKLANKVAKNDRGGTGVCDFSDPERRAAAYQALPLSEVWGMGRASVAKLEALGVSTVAGFVALPLADVRALLTVTGLRTHAELRGISCLPLSLAPPAKKTIACTRSFGRPVTAWDEMREAVATYTARAAEKMRRHGLQVAALQVFMHTNSFAKGDAQYANSRTLEVEPTLDSSALIAAAVRAAAGLWRDGFRYSKAGVIFIDLYHPEDLPASMFPTRDPVRSGKLMQALDSVNLRFGRDTLRPGGLAAKAGWSMRQAKVSPRYTTRAEEMLQATA